MKPLANKVTAHTFLVPLVVAVGLAGCAHRPMTDRQLARSAVSVGAAVLITGVIVFAEHRDMGADNQQSSTGSTAGSVALPPK